MTPTHRHIAGYLFGLGAGAVWGTTGPLSTALYAQGTALTGIGFWRIFLGTLALLAYSAWNRGLLAIDRRVLERKGGNGDETEERDERETKDGGGHGTSRGKDSDARIGPPWGPVQAA